MFLHKQSENICARCTTFIAFVSAGRTALFVLHSRRTILFQPVKGVDPVRFEIVGQQNDRAQHPCHRIGCQQRLDIIPQTHNDGDIGNTEQSPAAQGSKHGDHRLARASQDSADTVGNGGQEIKPSHDPRLRDTIGHDLRRITEQLQQIG